MQYILLDNLRIFANRGGTRDVKFTPILPIILFLEWLIFRKNIHADLSDIFYKYPAYFPFILIYIIGVNGEGLRIELRHKRIELPPSYMFEARKKNIKFLL